MAPSDSVTPAPRKRGKKKARKARLSRLQRPTNMSLEDWQVELRRQFGVEQKFEIVQLGEHPVFSDFHVTNPASGNTYRVRIRGAAVGDNACTCPDFLTNTLGTCKHVEFTLARITRRRLLRAQLNEGHQPAHSELYLQYGSQREVRFRPGSECPVELARLAATYFDETGALRHEAVNTFETFLEEAGKLDPDLDCGSDVLAYLAEVRDAQRRQDLVKEAFPRGGRSAAFKDLLKVNLYDYQRDGALFAARTGRCLIGDEMGLGKTIQAIAASEIMARHFGVERVLVICPTSLKHQWQREIERFAGRPVGVIGGLAPTRHALFQQPGHFFKVTNYDTIHRDLDAIQAWAPDLVVLDEAQRIKNWATRAARCVKKIASPYAIVLTGTPLENRLEELVSIVQFVDLFRLGPTFRLLHEHQVTNEVGKVVGYQNLDRLGQTLAPILIRRQKAQVLTELPERIDTNVFVPLTRYQRELHTENREVVARIVAKWKRYRFLSEADKRRLMAALQNMRMVCDSSYLLDPQTNEGQKVEEATTLMAELLERPEAKIVVFSSWLKMHELLIRELTAKGIGHGFFHGGLSSPARKVLVDRFREDPTCRVFLATDAGGVGLNLQHANVVMNLDLPWNPAVLEQRIGRVHRLGQQQPVQVVNFVAKSSIEEGMLGLLSFKTSLFKGVLDGGDKDVFLGGTKLTKFMESVEAATAAIPEPKPEEEAEEPPTPEPAEVREPAARNGQPVATPAPEPTAPVNPWAGLLEAGMSLLQQFAAPAAGQQAANGPVASVQRDEQTGETYLRVPVPPPEVLAQALDAVGKLLASLRR